MIRAAAAEPFQVAATPPADRELAAALPYGSYLAGLVASNRRDFASAADFMLQALAADPENRELMERTFYLVAAEGRYEQAIELAKRIMEVNPLDSIARLVIGIDAAKRDDPGKAAEMLSSFSGRGLYGIAGSMLGSWLDLGRGDLAAARTRIGAIRDIEGVGAYHHLHLALINDVVGAEDEARPAYQAALDAVVRPSIRLIWLAGNFYERKGPGGSAEDLYGRFGEGTVEASLFEPALSRLAKGAAPKPEIADYGAGVAEALFDLATMLSQEGYNDQALIFAHSALHLRPNFELASILLGEILESQQRDAMAVAVYSRIPQTSPFTWMVRLRIADALQRLDRQDDAIRELEGLAAERPAQFEPLFRVGNLLRAQERFNEAVNAYDRAFERLSQSNEPHWRMHYFRGIALERAGDWNRAEKDLLAALDLEPEQPYVMNYLAYSWVEQQTRLEEAKSMLARAVELRPDDGYIVDSLGWVYYRLSDYEDAVVQLERAVELRPQDPVINDHLGDAYWAVNRHHEARFQWRRALSLGPSSETASTIEAKIRRGLDAAHNNN